MLCAERTSFSSQLLSSAPATVQLTEDALQACRAQLHLREAAGDCDIAMPEHAGRMEAEKERETEGGQERPNGIESEADEEQDEVDAPQVSRVCCGVCGRDGFVGERGLNTHRAKNPVRQCLPPPARFPTHATC